MTSPTDPPIFDGHNDVVLRLVRRYANEAVAAFIDGDRTGHLDLPRMREGGFAGGFFAMFVPSPDGTSVDFNEMKAPEGYQLPLPPVIPAADAWPVVLRMAALLSRIENSSHGAIRICTSAADIRQCVAADSVAMILHIEGAEIIDPDFYALDVLYRAGLRSVGLVWSRPTVFGHGVPFCFPGDPDTGPGLTDDGKRLVRALNERRMVIDLSHLNEKGFWDVVALSDAPLIATHSNAHALCRSTRNLTDRQLAAIRDSGGVVGVNFATCFIRPDGRMDAQTGLDQLLRHLDYLIERLGPDGVGFGSDFDGAIIPADIGDVSGLTTLRLAMRKHGFDEPLLQKLCLDNWVGVLERTFGS